MNFSRFKLCRHGEKIVVIGVIVDPENRLGLSSESDHEGDGRSVLRGLLQLRRRKKVFYPGLRFDDMVVTMGQWPVEEEGPQKNVVFLDLSGVLTVGCRKTPIQEEFNRDAIFLLNRLCDVGNAEIVISSDWVQHEPETSFPEVVKLLRAHGLLANVQGYTKQAFDTTFLRRPQEISAYLDEHPDIEGFVILDDMPLPIGLAARAYLSTERELPPDETRLGDRFVWINDGNGLTEQRVEEALQALAKGRG